MTLSPVCEEHVRWSEQQPGGALRSRHAFDHTAGSKGDYCYWCGQHRSGDGRYREDAGVYTMDDWWNDVIDQGGVTEE